MTVPWPPGKKPPKFTAHSVPKTCQPKGQTEKQEGKENVDEERLWALFFATGLPQVYLAIRGVEEEREVQAALPEARTAFRAGPLPARQI